MSRPEWIEVGRVSRPHGVHGEVRVMVDSDNPNRFAPGSVMYARPARVGLAGPPRREHRQLTVAGVRGHGDFLIVAFDEVVDREAAEGLRGLVLEVRSSQLPELAQDEFYPFDLIGLEVRHPGGDIVGRVIEVIESPAHPVLVVSLVSGSECMVPFVLAAVPTVDVTAGHLIVEREFIAGYGGGDDPAEMGTGTPDGRATAGAGAGGEV